MLCLLLADGDSLITMVVPSALVEFSRGVLRRTFSSIVRKRVYTLNFDRNDDLVNWFVCFLLIFVFEKKSYTVFASDFHFSSSFCFSFLFLFFFLLGSSYRKQAARCSRLWRCGDCDSSVGALADAQVHRNAFARSRSECAGLAPLKARWTVGRQHSQAVARRCRAHGWSGHRTSPIEIRFVLRASSFFLF